MLNISGVVCQCQCFAISPFITFWCHIWKDLVAQIGHPSHENWISPAYTQIQWKSFYCRVWDQVKLAREASNTSELFDQVFGFLKCCTLSMKMLPLSLDGGAVFRVYTSKMLTVILPLYSRKFPLKWKQTKLRAVRRWTSISSNYSGFKSPAWQKQHKDFLCKPSESLKAPISNSKLENTIV